MALLVVSALTAYAGTGNISHATVNDIEYYFYSSSYTNGLSAWGFTEVGTVSRGNVPGAWMGVLSKLYNSNGDLKLKQGWYYSDKACASISVRAGDGSVSDSGRYYAVGNIKLYNSKGGYNTYNTVKSPYVVVNSEPEEIEINRNENGEIYGSEYYLNQVDIQPDLIAAIGDNGVHGYVKDSDLNCDIEPKSLEEAMNMKYDSCSIPLYDKNGRTIIDSFTTNAGTVEYIAE